MDEVILRCNNARARARARAAEIAPFVPNELSLTVSLGVEMVGCARG